MRDFAPYVAKIKASGADTVITGNWGSDLALLIKAANDAGLNVKFYTYYAVTTGTPTAMGAASAGKVYQVGYAHYNMGGEMQHADADEFKKKFNDDLYTTDVYTVFAMLIDAFVKAKSTDPVKVAAAMEGMKFKSFNGDVEMRKTDHQLQQGLYISKWEKAERQVPVQPGEHRLHVRAGEVLRRLRGEHAHLLPDEAPLQPADSAEPAAVSKARLQHSGLFFSDAIRESDERRILRHLAAQRRQLRACCCSC